MQEFIEWRRSLEVVPLLVELRKRADEIRRAEIEKARRRLGPLTPEQEKALEAATSAIVNKLLHAPTVRLKELAGHGAGRPRGHRAPAVRPVSRIRIGTRGSALALWQAEHVKARLEALGHEVALRVITTTGDRMQDRRLESVGGKGAFLKEIEEALRRARGGPRRALAEGRADRAAGRAARCARSSSAPTRATRSSRPGRGSPSCRAGASVGTTSLRRRALVRRAAAGPRAPGPARQRRHAPAAAARGALRRDPAGDGRAHAARPRRRGDRGARPAPVRARAGAGGDRARVPRRTTRRCATPSRRSTTRPPPGRSRPSARSWPRSAAAATCRSGPTPSRPDPGWSSWPSSRRPTAAPCCAPSAAATDPAALGGALADELLAQGARALIGG